MTVAQVGFENSEGEGMYLSKIHKLKKTQIIFSLALLIPVFVLLSCSFKEEKIDPNANLEWQKKVITSDFGALNRYIFKPKCITCHKSGTNQNHNVSMASYEKIVNGPTFPPLVVKGNPKKSSLYTAVKESRMPKGGSLSSHEIQMIYEWIKKGAPQTGGGGNGGGDNDSCLDGEPGCDDLCSDEYEPQCVPKKAPDCEPDEPGCDFEI